MDITQVFHSKPLNPQEYLNCSKTNGKTFVDDNLLHSKPSPGQTLKDSIQDTMSTIQNYTDANLLSLNPSKTKIMIIS